MKQYCRYCAHACLQGDDLFYCQELNNMYAGKYAKRVNNCKYFAFCPMDLFNPDREYSPNKNRTRRLHDDGYKQESIFDNGYGKDWLAYRNKQEAEAAKQCEAIFQKETAQ